MVQANGLCSFRCVAARFQTTQIQCKKTIMPMHFSAFIALAILFWIIIHQQSKWHKENINRWPSNASDMRDLANYIYEPSRR